MSTAAKKTNSPSQPTGCWIRPERRLAIYLRDDVTCIYCLRNLHGADPRDVTLGHLVCKADGGTNDSSNLVTACRACNCSRQDKPLARFASGETRAHIRRNTRRDMTKYLRLAKAMIAGTTAGCRSRDYATQRRRNPDGSWYPPVDRRYRGRPAPQCLGMGLGLARGCDTRPLGVFGADVYLYQRARALVLGGQGEGGQQRGERAARHPKRAVDPDLCGP